MFSILKEFIQSGRIQCLESLRELKPKKVVFILIDSFGLKEFNYLTKNQKLFKAGREIILFNPFPSTKMAYKQIFFQGKESIFQYLSVSSKFFAVIDNRMELSLIPNEDNIIKVIRKNDKNAFSRAKELLQRSDLLWLHLMSLDHLYHSGIKSAHKFLLTFAQKLETFIQTFESETLCLIFGDHGKHHLKSTPHNKSPKEKRDFYRALNKMRYEATRTVLYPIFLGNRKS